MGSRKPKGAPEVVEVSQSGVTLTKEDIDEIIKRSVFSAIAAIKEVKEEIDEMDCIEKNVIINVYFEKVVCAKYHEYYMNTNHES